MNDIINPPQFLNTIFHKECDNITGSHHDNEALWILSNITTDNPSLGIVSSSHKALSFVKLIKGMHVFLPKSTPSSTITKLSQYTTNNNIHIFGDTFSKCYEMADEYMLRNDIHNTSNIFTHEANHITAKDILKRLIPKYIFVPSTNFNLATGIAEYFLRQSHTETTIVACILPDHPKSPRFNYTYDTTPFKTTIFYEKYNIPLLNPKYKSYDNLILKTTKNPNFCYRKYHPQFPTIDPLNYIAMQISEVFPENDRKVIILTGKNLS